MTGAALAASAATSGVRPLSVSRAKDRETMTAVLVSLVHGRPDWEASCEEFPGRETWVHFVGPRGLRATIDLDGRSRQQRQGTHVVSWVVRGGQARLAKGFAQDVNPFHRCKATDICEGWLHLLATLQRRMDAATDGTAFEAVEAVEVVEATQ